ncbi:MAG TPA: branched-chain amino acid ABC transporter permease [Bacillota bacterium]|jgi:branched-chain amino acid transport system permease protein
MTRLARFPWVPLSVLLALAFPLVASRYLVHLGVLIAIYTILTLSLNLVSGYAGQLALGQAAFYALGAYASALLTLNGYPFLLGLPAAGVVAALGGLIVGLPTLRSSGFYLGMITLGFGEIVRLVLLNWSSVTRGPMGLTNIPPAGVLGFTFASVTSYYYLTLAILALVALAVHRLVNSRLGDALVAIREDELAAKAMGVDTGYLKVLAFTVSGFIAGLAGSLYAHYISFINPSSFGSGESFLIVSMALLGGTSIPGSIIGTAVLVVLPEVFRPLADYRLFFYGAALILLMIYRPNGLIPERRLAQGGLLEKLAGRRPRAGGAAHLNQGGRGS